MKIARQTGLQTTRTIAPAIALGFGPQKAVRLSREKGLGLPLGIGCQVRVEFAPQTGSETGMELDSRRPFGVALDTTPGTVMGTVPPLVRRASISACFLRILSLTCGTTRS
jgi:hypothetical protein